MKLAAERVRTIHNLQVGKDEVSASIRVFLLDGHDVVRVGVRTLLAADRSAVPRIEVVGEARTAEEALPQIADLRPDVLILDCDLTDRSGIDVCHDVAAMDIGTRCLILTNDADDHVMSQAILAGAAGYVLEHIEAASLVAGVRLIAKGHTLFDPDAAAKVIREVEQRRRMYDSVADLTPQQSRILLLLAEGLSNREIAERLVLAEKTVKNHITGLLAKLGVSHRTQAALLATQLLKEGIVPRPAESGRPAVTPGGGQRSVPVPPLPRRPSVQPTRERSS